MATGEAPAQIPPGARPLEGGLLFTPVYAPRPVYFPGDHLTDGSLVGPGSVIPEGYEVIGIADRFKGPREALQYYAQLGLPGAVVDLFQHGVHMVRYGAATPYVVVQSSSK